MTIHRLFALKSFIVSFALAFLVTTILLISFQITLLQSNPGSIVDAWAISLANLIIFACLSYLYINVLTIGEASVRIKFLSFFDKGIGLSEDDILSRYNSRTILNLRKDRLLQDGQLAMKNGRIMLGKRRQILIAKFCVFWRKIIFGTEAPL